MLMGYARVSTDDQRLDLQRDALAQAGVANDNVYQEQVSGVATKRPELEHLKRALRSGDTLVVWKLDRLGRSVKELITLTDWLRDHDIELISLKDNIDTTTAVGRMVFHMLAAFAQFERDIISERTIAGLKAARARGHCGGRKPKITKMMLKAIEAMLLDETVRMQQVADQFHVSRAAIYRARQRAAQKKAGTVAV